MSVILPVEVKTVEKDKLFVPAITCPRCGELCDVFCLYLSDEGTGKQYHASGTGRLQCRHCGWEVIVRDGSPEFPRDKKWRKWPLYERPIILRLFKNGRRRQGGAQIRPNSAGAYHQRSTHKDTRPWTRPRHRIYFGSHT